MAEEAGEGAEALNPADLRTLTPNLPRKVMVKLSAFIEIKRELGRDELAAALRRLHTLWQDESWSVELRAVALLLADLIDQGWEVISGDDSLHMQPPGLRIVGESINEAKDRLRREIGRASCRERV